MNAKTIKGYIGHAGMTRRLNTVAHLITLLEEISINSVIPDYGREVISKRNL